MAIVQDRRKHCHLSSGIFSSECALLLIQSAARAQRRKPIRWGLYSGSVRLISWSYFLWTTMQCFLLIRAKAQGGDQAAVVCTVFLSHVHYNHYCVFLLLCMTYQRGRWRLTTPSCYGQPIVYPVCWTSTCLLLIINKMFDQINMWL